MQAIVVRELVDRNGNHKFKAICDAKSLTICRDAVRYALATNNIPIMEFTQARFVAEELAHKLGWDDGKYYGKMIMGTLPKNAGFVFVFPPKDKE